MDKDKLDIQILDLLPNELWAIVISHLPRTSRHSLAKLTGFDDIVNG